MARYPQAGAIHSEGGYSAAAVIPLMLDRRAIGGLTLSFPGPRAFTEDERSYLLALGAQCAQALERARLYEAEQAARRLAERQRDQLAFLAEASFVLDSMFDSHGRLQRLAELAVPRIADWCAIDLLEDGEIQHVAVIHSDPAKLSLAMDLRARYPTDLSARKGVPEVLRTGTSQLIPVITDEMIVQGARDPEHLRLIRELGMSSAMVVPLIVRGRTLGALTLVAAESRAHYGEQDLAFAEELARRAALSLDNVRLFEEQQRIARMLQSSLLPRRLPKIPGIRTAARYIAAGQGNEVGGDFYDVFSTESAWSVVIGDVQGKGAHAAALTALVRYTIRAESQHDHSAARILSRLNGAMLREQADEDARFCSVLYARVVPVNGGLRLTIACGGHPAPLIVRATGEVERLVCAGTVLGIHPDPKLEDVTAHVGANDLVVFYTDGVTEGRGDAGFYGDQRLEALLAGCVGWEPEDVASRIINALLEFQHARPRDDIAVIVLGG